MDWLNWIIRAFSFVGGAFFLFCFLLGFYTFWGVMRNACELYKAKRKFYAYQKQNKEFKIWMNGQENEEEKE